MIHSCTEPFVISFHFTGSEDLPRIFYTVTSKVSPGFCENLGDGGREGGGKEVRKGGRE